MPSADSVSVPPELMEKEDELTMSRHLVFPCRHDKAEEAVLPSEVLSVMEVPKTFIDKPDLFGVRSPERELKETSKAVRLELMILGGSSPLKLLLPRYKNRNEAKS